MHELEETKSKVEALLFASGKKLELTDIAKLCGIRKLDHIKEAVLSLQQDYAEKKTSLKLFEEGTAWKLTVKDEFIPTVQKIVTDTELDKSMMETLAVIAWKYPILQANVIHIRTNKAYDHLNALEEMSFINREKFGRTKKIRLTEKFFQYFDLPPGKADAFTNLIPKDVKERLNQREEEIDAMEKTLEEIERKQEEMRAKKADTEVQAPEVDLENDFGNKTKLETYETTEEKEKLGELEVIETAEEAEAVEEAEQELEIKKKKKKKTAETEEEKAEEAAEEEAEEKAEKAMKEPITKDEEAAIEQLLHPPKEETESSEPKPEEKQPEQ